MGTYRGVIIEESLEDKSVLERVTVISTRVEEVTDKHKTPWLSSWTLHTVDVPEAEAQTVAHLVSRSLDRKHGGSWYADFKDQAHHYIIFPDRIFCIDRTSKEQYDEAKQYGIELGIPEYQVDFHPEVQQWER